MYWRLTCREVFRFVCIYLYVTHLLAVPLNDTASLWNDSDHTSLAVILANDNMTDTLLRACQTRDITTNSHNCSLTCQSQVDHMTLRRSDDVCLLEQRKTNVSCSQPQTPYTEGVLVVEVTVEEYRGVNVSTNSTKVSTNRAEIQNPSVDVQVPPDLFSRVPRNRLPKKVKFLFAVSVNTSSDQNGDRLLNDFQLHMEVDNIKIQNMSTPFTLTILHMSLIQEEYVPKCVFQNQSGQWDTFGCYIDPPTPNKTTCRCHHFSFFGALLVRDVPVSEVHLRVLQDLTYIGCAISATFCTIALLMHCLLSTGGAADHALLIHLQLIGALLLLNVLFLCSVGVAPLASPALCRALGLLLHYALLCCFTWMALEAFHLYRLLIQVYNTYVRRYLVKLSLLGWGAPAVVVIVIVAVSTKNYGLTDTGAGEMCWIPNLAVHYASIVSYLALVLLFNSCMLIYVIVTMMHLHSPKTSPQKGLNSRTVSSVLGLTCALGLTWGLGFLSIGYTNLPILYTFTILNSLQGFFVFLWVCLRRRRREEPAFTTKSSAPDPPNTSQEQE
ncbi:adhesion G-protein coupled receptor G5-like [Megalops cyprinoides]|uniref:adhesion G-protein coupled receptor G5-like n=1 Tax=Megalops cyprinoides TaxID=118141 RepID=UPI001865636A|nr:adhesion G-protein coupled receptor G5-like [Megalops cyprinoides]